MVDFEGNLKLQGPFSLHDYPMDYIDFQQCRDTDNGIENPYHNNIQALGVLLLELVLDVSKIPTDDNITDESKKDNVTGNITQDMICQAFMSGCPERLEALILWCIDSDPFLLPTMKHCREEMRMIYVDFCERNHIILREENEDVEEVEEAVEGKTTCNAVVEETSEYQDL